MEDLFIDEFFYKNFDPTADYQGSVPAHDLKIFKDLWYLLDSQRLFTKKQADLLSRLMQKYNKNFHDQDFDRALSGQKFKRPFREIDTAKKIYAETDHDGVIHICFKFPYSLKSQFDEIFYDANERNFSHWDDENKVRKIELYKINFLQILEFANYHQLEIDKTIWDLADEIDEIWQNKDQLEKRFVVTDGKVELINASESAQRYFDEHRAEGFFDNLLLAKELAHVCDCVPGSPVFQKICSVDNNLFYINDIDKFLYIHKQTSVKTCAILDRTSDYKTWLKTFVNACDQSSIPRSDIKVCFREDTKDSDFNQWIKLSEIGGKTDSGRIYIFLGTPAKWLYKDLESFKIVLVNSLFPHTNKNTQNYINHHPLVIYAGGNKPSIPKDSKIEEL